MHCCCFILASLGLVYDVSVRFMIDQFDSAVGKIAQSTTAPLFLKFSTVVETSSDCDRCWLKGHSTDWLNTEPKLVKRCTSHLPLDRVTGKGLGVL